MAVAQISASAASISTLPWKPEQSKKREASAESKKIDTKANNSFCSPLFVHKTFIKYEILHHV
jgi:hypothetical protein